MSYAIFRSESINTLKDLGEIGAHNKRDKKSYKSNPDVDMSRSKNNIEIVPLNERYSKGYYELVKEYKKEYEEKQKTTREDRRKPFDKMLDDSNSVVHMDEKTPHMHCVVVPLIKSLIRELILKNILFLKSII